MVNKNKIKCDTNKYGIKMGVIIKGFTVVPSFFYSFPILKVML